jgi:hypothetical protein
MSEEHSSPEAKGHRGLAKGCLGLIGVSLAAIGGAVALGYGAQWLLGY